MVGFEIVGKLTLMGKWDFSNRWYMDQAGNAYLVDVVIGGVRVIAKRQNNAPSGGIVTGQKGRKQ
jgi:hypothetical protein